MNPLFETVQLEGNSCFKTQHFECGYLQDDHSWHYHPECELTFIVKGKGTRFIGDSVEHFDEGDLVLIAPNIPHCWANNNKDEHNEIVTMQFLPTCLGDDFLNSPDAHVLVEMFSRAKRGMQIKGNVAAQVGQLLISLHEKNGLSRLSGFIEILDLISQSNDNSLLSSELYAIDNSEFHSGRMRKVMEYIQAHLIDEIRQTDIAELVHMTPQGFSRFFRATTGRTFVSFVNIVRIMEACRLLVSSEEDITTIAFECGYGNLSNFNRRFMEQKNCTPTEYRNNHSLIATNPE
ncbi:AraC family transcriptional regulator [Thalassotalea fonticola]|uniref:AraC family transcriptional regulator n=1 Tax=Thalassotalea fonticola TaxID=3065649 RepID=A0ABZ0GK83_9GAMM|nr:AraC family transcriptional regulator [Colwelliaceae bacterium S1-1]